MIFFCFPSFSLPSALRVDFQVVSMFCRADFQTVRMSGTRAGVSFSIFQRSGCSPERIFPLFSRLKPARRFLIRFCAGRKQVWNRFFRCEQKKRVVEVAVPNVGGSEVIAGWILLMQNGKQKREPVRNSFERTGSRSRLIVSHGE